jgi:hypothetical protein
MNDVSSCIDTGVTRFGATNRRSRPDRYNFISSPCMRYTEQGLPTSD